MSTTPVYLRRLTLTRSSDGAFATSLIVAPASVFGLLDQKIKAKGRVYFGSALDPNTFNDPAVRPIAISGDFGAFTARGQFNFTNPCLALSVIQNHVTTEVSRYRGRIFAKSFQDVVNEVFNDNGTFRNSVDGVSIQLLGESFIEIAFRAARAADPGAKLYINDFNLDGPGPKIDALIALVGRLKSRGVPIDGIGSQSHLILGQVGGVAGQLPRLAATGLQVALTELDIRIQSPVTTQKLQQQQNDFNTVARACIAVPNCVGITVWGISDKNSFVDSTFPGFTQPLLFDRNLQKKPAYNGVDAALS